MAERAVELTAHHAGELHLRLLGSACDGCSGGCAGRCNLFATGNDGDFILPAPPGFAAQVGDRLRLCIDDGQLRRTAWRGYGLAWLGLVLGAGLGHAVGTLWLQRTDLPTLAGLVAGTFSAVLLSKRHLPEPRLLPPGPPDSPQRLPE